MNGLKPICIGCNKHPDELEEYIEAAEGEGISPDNYVELHEGTWNPNNGHFLCTDCYIKAGMPGKSGGWIAP